ncbi:MAG TPA: DNA primase [Candidatus Methylomirabilis sp.]|nr:DNA primase [Candidatus Methylomirabilis sp.]
MIPEDVIAEILQRTDIVELIGAYLPLKAAGRTHKALCPFHNEKTPSFVVNPERQIFHCFGCGEGGDAITFLVKHEHLTFPDAARFLAERAGITLPAWRGGGGSPAADGRLTLLEVQRQALEHFRENLQGPEASAAREYLAGRGITPAIIERFQLGYALPRWDGLLRALKKRGHPDGVLEAAGLTLQRQSGSGHYDRFRNRLMIPIWDVSGKVVGFGGRALDSSEVKYLNSPETATYRKGTHLYGLNLAARAIRERKQAIVVEGYFDAIMLHTHGFEQAVATLGTALTTDQARLLGRYASTVVLLFDPDAAGIGAARRNLEHLINVDLEWHIVLLSEGLDPDAFLRARGAPAFAAALDGAQDLVEFFLDRRVSGLDMADPLQQARAVDGLVELLSTIDNPIRREGYIRRVSQWSAITDRTLLEAVARQRGLAGRRDAARSAELAAGRPAPKGVSSPPTAEEHLISIGLNYPAWRERIAAALAPEDVRDPILRRLFTEIIQAGASPASPTGGHPMSLYPTEVQRRLSSLLAAGPWSGSSEVEDPAGGPEGHETLRQMVEDCLARIGQQREASQRQRLRQELADADRGGDRTRLLQLLSEHPSVKRGPGNS